MYRKNDDEVTAQGVPWYVILRTATSTAEAELWLQKQSWWYQLRPSTHSDWTLEQWMSSALRRALPEFWK